MLFSILGFVCRVFMFYLTKEVVMKVIMRVILVGLLGVISSVVFANEKSISFTKDSLLISDYYKLDHHDSVITSGRLRGTITFSESTDPALFPNGKETPVNVVICIKQSKKKDYINLVSHWEQVTDKGKIYYVSKRVTGDSETGLGKTTIVGGTGAYKGIQGSCPYKVQYDGDRVKVHATCKATIPDGGGT